MSEPRLPERFPAERLRTEYRSRRAQLDRLCEEAVWEFTASLANSTVKTHSFTWRVKEEDSFIEKVERKAYTDPWNEIEDLVGLRAVCLFRSDLRKLEDIVRDQFVVMHEEDTVERSSVETFGYMSLHLNVQLSRERAGPRYDDIKGLTFEIQLRTILMDAWANVSHYLDYKGESSIPHDLRRDFMALSGLFYVADRHFEFFFAEALKAREEAVRAVSAYGADLDAEINLDTLLAYLAKKFPDREHSDAATVSELVEEIEQFGWTRLDRLDEAVDAYERDVLEYERQYPPGGEPGRRYFDVGVVRHSVAFADEAYARYKYPPLVADRFKPG